MPKGVFRGHTPRQHRATSRKGGLARMKVWTKEQQRAASRKGGDVIRARWARIQEQMRAERFDAPEKLIDEN